MAASPAAKGEEVRTEAGLRIVEAPLPVVPCPVAETEALVSLCVEVILAEGEHGRLHLRRCGRREFPSLDGQIEVAVFKDIQLVEISTVDARFHERFHVLVPHVHRLVRQPVHEVDDDSALVVGQKLLQVGEYRLPVVDAAHGLTDLRIEGLHAERHAVHAVSEPYVHLLRDEVMHTAFEGEFVVIGKRQTSLDRGKKAACIFRREGGRCAASDEYGLNRRAGESRGIRTHLDVLYQMVDVAVFFVLVRPVLEEGGSRGISSCRREYGYKPSASDALPRALP